MQSYSIILIPTRKRVEITQKGCYSIFKYKTLITNKVQEEPERKKYQIVTLDYLKTMNYPLKRPTGQFLTKDND